MTRLPPPLAWPLVVPLAVAADQSKAAYRALDRCFQPQPQPQDPDALGAAMRAALSAAEQASALEYYMRLDVPGGQ